MVDDELIDPVNGNTAHDVKFAAKIECTRVDITDYNLKCTQCRFRIYQFAKRISHTEMNRIKATFDHNSQKNEDSRFT